MLKEAYVYGAMSLAKVFDWRYHFKKDRTSVECDVHPVGPSTRKNTETVEALVA